MVALPLDMGALSSMAPGARVPLVLSSWVRSGPSSGYSINVAPFVSSDSVVLIIHRSWRPSLWLEELFLSQLSSPTYVISVDTSPLKAHFLSEKMGED